MAAKISAKTRPTRNPRVFKKLTVRILDRPASRPRLRMVQKAHAALPSAWIKCAKACAGLVAGRVARSVS
jgi:hypothetical protein